MSAVSDDGPPLDIPQLTSAYIADIENLFSRLTSIRDKVDAYSLNRVLLLKEKYDLSLALRQELTQILSNINRLNAAKPTTIPKTDVSKKVSAFDDVLEFIAVKYITALDSAKKSEPTPELSRPSTSGSNTHHHFALPSINIPKFSNNIKEFPRFISLFESVYGPSNTNISNVQRLHYLTSLLTGEALAIVNQFPLTNDGYLNALQSLNTRYNNKRTLATVYVSELLQYTPAKKATAESLRNFLEIHNDNVNALKSLTEIGDLADFILVSLSISHLDPLSRKLFENTIERDSLPSFKGLLQFVIKQLQTQELFDLEKSSYPIINESKPALKNSYHPKVFSSISVSKLPSKKLVKTKTISPNEVSCIYCTDGDRPHRIFTCPKFLSLSVKGRVSWVTSVHRCIACLHPGHSLSECKSSKSCYYCNSKTHSSVLCDQRAQDAHSPEAPVAPEVTLLSCISKDNNSFSGILPTISALVYDKYGFAHPVVCVLDTGCQKNLITLKTAKSIGLHLTKNYITVSGIGGTQKSLGEAEIVITSRFDPQVKIPIKVNVLEKISTPISPVSVDPEYIKHLPFSELADPEPFISKNIDILLSSTTSFQLIYHNNGKEKYSDFNTLLADTPFGKIIIGSVPLSEPSVPSVLLTKECCEVKLNLQMEEMFERDGIPDPQSEYPINNPDHDYCEQHFLQSFKRLQNGRFQVSLPTKPNPPQIGNNRNRALACFHSMEKRLNNSGPDAIQTYHVALQNYFDNRQISVSTSKSDYLLNQHVVFKKSSGKAKLVFDPTLRATNCKNTLNDTFFTGPMLLRQLNYILISVRKYPVCLAADIETFYRSISIDEKSSDKLHIFCRMNGDIVGQSGSIVECKLVHLPYGLSCSPFLALRCLQQLAIEHSETHPLAVKAILYHSYMDDFLIGCTSVNDAISTRTELIELCASAQLNLGKFVSSHSTALAGLPTSSLGTAVNLSESSSLTVPILGLLWQPQTDHFIFQMSDYTENLVTRRTATSYVAKLFDSLGLINPCIFWLKKFIQTLWHDYPELGWDKTVPDNLSEKFKIFTSNMSALTELKIPRYISIPNSFESIVVFCDASESGYGTCCYLISKNETTISSHLLLSKSKLAPKRVKRTIPQLELASCELSCKLLNWLSAGNLPFDLSKVTIYSDSEIALAYIRTPPFKLKVYAANRVSSILELTKNISVTWKHCKSTDNPADYISRGLEPTKLVNNTLWFYGPPFLREPNLNHASPSKVIPDSQLPDLKQHPTPLVLNTQPTEPNIFIKLINKFSTYSKLINTIAYVKRFIFNCSHNRNDRLVGPLSSKEMEESKIITTKIQQHHSFSELWKSLKTGNPPKSMISLSPFIDDNNLLRVRGRIISSNIPFDSRHPLILPKQCNLSIILCRFYHALCGHSGTNLSLSLCRQKFWIVSGRSLMKSIIHNCIVCAKLNPRSPAPIQGDLPSSRTDPCFPFRNEVGVDAFGPYPVKLSARKNSGTSKLWALLFLCQATRAVHIEPVSSLSASHFLAAFDRFTARRGLPKVVKADNGGNFVAGGREIMALSKFLQESKNIILSALATRSVVFQHIPAYSPWMGGWEPMVKQASRLLSVLLKENLYFEEYCTVFARVEAILNSRPYLPLTTDANDPHLFLSPGCFISGGPLVGPPTISCEPPANLKERFNRLRAIIAKFWSIWHLSVLNTLLQKQKWPRGSQVNLKPGQFVWVKDVKSVPASWPLGIVEKAYPDHKGTVRIIDVRTASGVLRRSARNLILVPLTA